MVSLQIFAALMCLLFTFASAKLHSKYDMPADLTDELYCLGCEVTVKALEMMLSPPAPDSMDVRVVEAMATVCDKKHFANSEYSSTSLLTACKYLTGSEGEVIEPLLVSHFSRRQRPSYLDLVQQVCIDLTAACPNTARSAWQDKDSYIELESEEFELHAGQNIRVPSPVREIKEEL